jgi:multiple sugar transport system ATP-binding protein
MAKVVLKDVTKIFDKKVWAVKNLNVEIQDKEFVVLVGPSGCGKSTTLRMIAGLEEVTEGEIYIGEQLVNDVPPKDRDIAMVFQNYALYPHMTVRQNMAFGLKLRKYPKKEIEERVQEAADILGISELLDRKPKALSGGQRQRVAVGRAIVRKPQVFLFDEPLSNLDAKLRVQMRTEISKLHSRLGTTMIYVTHDQMEAMTMGDRIVIQKDGVVHQVDTPLNLYNKPVNKFVAGFIGSPAMNFMDGKLAEENGELHFDEGNFKVKVSPQMASVLKPYSSREVTFGLRPEDIYEKGLSEGAREKAPVKAALEVLEPMGNELFLYLTTGTNPLVARVDVHEAPKVGQKIDLIFDMSKARFFDVETEEAIG